MRHTFHRVEAHDRIPNMRRSLKLKSRVNEKNESSSSVTFTHGDTHKSTQMLSPWHYPLRYLHPKGDRGGCGQEEDEMIEGIVVGMTREEWNVLH